jgi:hypothetical protein
VEMKTAIEWLKSDLSAEQVAAVSAEPFDDGGGCGSSYANFE